MIEGGLSSSGQSKGQLVRRVDFVLDRLLYYGSSLLLIMLATAVMYTVIMILNANGSDDRLTMLRQ